MSYEASISGIQAAQGRINWSAHNTANLNTDEARAMRVSQRERTERGGVDTMLIRTDERPDAVIERIEQIEASHSMKANLQVLKTQNEMTGETIDLFA